MSIHKEPSDPPNPLMFGLMIQKYRDLGKTKIKLQSENKGIPAAEVILIVESWLEKTKDRFKDGIKSSISFDKE